MNRQVNLKDVIEIIDEKIEGLNQQNGMGALMGLAGWFDEDKVNTVVDANKKIIKELRAIIDMATIAIFWVVYEFYNFSKDKAFEEEVLMIINLALLFFLMRMIQLIAQLNPMIQEFVAFLKKKGVNVDELDQK